MRESLGQKVVWFKSRLAHDSENETRHTIGMAPERAPRLPTGTDPVDTPTTTPGRQNPFARWKPPTKKALADIMAIRIKAAREQGGYTQQTMADELGLRQTAYAKYEARKGGRPSLMPHIYLARFCELTGAKLTELLRDPR